MFYLGLAMYRKHRKRRELTEYKKIIFESFQSDLETLTEMLSGMNGAPVWVGL